MQIVRNRNVSRQHALKMAPSSSRRSADRLVIKRVFDPLDFEAICRFRYSVYVDEMNRPQKDADHEQQSIVDFLDDSESRLYGAWNGHAVVGTLRSNYLAYSDIGQYLDQYRLENLTSWERRHSSITTRLMVRQSHRNSMLAVRLACETYHHGLAEGVLFDFIDCNSHLVPFFTGLGYLVHADDVTHPEYGRVTVMRLNLTDRGHLERINSPFRRLLRSHERSLRASI